MDVHLLVPFDGSPQASKALEHAVERHPDATITLLHVIDPIDAGYSAEAVLPSYSEDWYESQRASANDLFDDARELTGRDDLETDIEVGRPSRIIVEYAREHDIDQVVMGSHGRSGVSRILLGSVAETVVRRSPVPVTVVR